MLTISRHEPSPTPVFDTYWAFATERQNVFFRRYASEPPPWTHDSVIGRFMFTNVYRSADRVSQFLIRDVIYGGDPSIEETFFRIMVFKLFNRIETWGLLQRELGEINFLEYSVERYGRILDRARRDGKAIYSSAYIMPSGITAFGSRDKHRNHLQLIDMLVKEGTPARIAEARSMKEVFDLLRSYPTVGPFLAYQFSIDINYSEITNFSEMDFVVAGPGARDGIRKCFADTCGLTDADIIRYVTDNQEREFESRGLEFRSLWGRRLQLIDCQNIFCEVDKYARVVHPEVGGLSKRTKIKRNFRPQASRIDYWFPPKWGINDRVRATGCPIV